jgi:hypothetical protein
MQNPSDGRQCVDRGNRRQGHVLVYENHSRRASR